MTLCCFSAVQSRHRSLRTKRRMVYRRTITGPCGARKMTLSRTRISADVQFIAPGAMSRDGCGMKIRKDIDLPRHRDSRAEYASGDDAAAPVLPVAVNYHLNRNCNFRCKGCYAVFGEDSSVRGLMLPKAEMFGIVSAVAAQPLPSGARARKLTFAGGEPTLCPWLPELLAHAKSAGLVTMVVTNGSRCTPDYLAALRPVLDWLTVSIDSLDEATNVRIGRASGRGRALTAGDYRRLLHDARSMGLRTKINTVVSRHNVLENLSGFLAESGIERWKVLQVMKVEGQNDAHHHQLAVAREEFDRFVESHASVADAGIRIVPEPVESIRGSYAMIDPQGRFFDSSRGFHRYSSPILEAGVGRAFAQVHFDADRFEERGGIYDFATPRKQREFV